MSLSTCIKKQERRFRYLLWMSCIFESYFADVQSNYGNTWIVYKICSKLTIKSPEQNQWPVSSLFFASFEQTSHIILMFPLLSLNK